MDIAGPWMALGIAVGSGLLSIAYTYGTQQLKHEFGLLKKELQHIGRRLDEGRDDRSDLYEKYREVSAKVDERVNNLDNKLDEKVSQLERDKVSRRDCAECDE